jgi:hypothetical protein
MALNENFCLETKENGIMQIMLLVLAKNFLEGALQSMRKKGL